MKKRAGIIAAVLLALFIAGCIGTGTITLKYEVGEIIVFGGSMDSREIDLTTNKDYNDNKDKIKSVDQVTVVGIIANNEPVANYAEIWLANVGTYTTPAEVRENAVRVFKSPEVAGDDTLFVDWDDGLNYVENQSDLKDAADRGHFWLYALANNAPFNMTYDFVLVITLTAGL